MSKWGKLMGDGLLKVVLMDVVHLEPMGVAPKVGVQLIVQEDIILYSIAEQAEHFN